MTPEIQLALIDRIHVHQQSGRGTDTAPSSMRVATATYTSHEHLLAERQFLDSAPTVVGLSGLLPGPNSYAAVTVGNSSVIVTRDEVGAVSAMLNVCRHRGAEVVAGCGHAARLACPYHGWTYEMDGTVAGRRRGEFFDDVTAIGLVRLPILEQHGLIWVSADPDTAIPPDPLHGAGLEIQPLQLDSFSLYDSVSFARPINWKLAVDTFCEAYHLSTLHRDSLAPLIYSDYALFDPFGPHGRMVAVRKSIGQLADQKRPDWSLLPHATILWFLVPGTVLIHQQDHIQLFGSRPGAAPDESILTTTLYVPSRLASDNSRWRRNFDLLVSVTDTEDFATAAGIQRGYRAAAQTHVTFGRNEPALQHLHRSLRHLIKGDV